MSRNAKSAGSSRSQKKAKGGTLVGIFIGLVLGILVALGVVWYMNRTPAPFTNKPQGASTGNGQAAPATGNGKSAEGGEKRFQFYEILPGKAEPQPSKAPEKAGEKAAEKTTPATAATADKSPAGKPADAFPAAPATPATKAPAELFLQAGSFQNAKDAENLKASLALMGQEASVQQVMLADKVWYRVRLGPFTSNDAAGRTKAELAKSGIEASLVRGKE